MGDLSSSDGACDGRRPPFETLTAVETYNLLSFDSIVVIDASRRGPEAAMIPSSARLYGSAWDKLDDGLKAALARVRDEYGPERPDTLLLFDERGDRNEEGVAYQAALAATASKAELGLRRVLFLEGGMEALFQKGFGFLFGLDFASSVCRSR